MDTDKKPNPTTALAQAGAQVALCEAMADRIKAGTMTIPEQGVPMMIGGLRVLITKDQTPIE